MIFVFVSEYSSKAEAVSYTSRETLQQGSKVLFGKVAHFNYPLLYQYDDFFVVIQIEDHCQSVLQVYLDKSNLFSQQSQTIQGMS